jgi:hypothetical protein
MRVAALPPLPRLLLKEACQALDWVHSFSLRWVSQDLACRYCA